MSEMKHTRRPWMVELDEENGRPIGIVAPDDMGIPGAVGHVVRRNGIGLPSSETALANAHLMAAAPDLLEVCERVLPMIESRIRGLGEDPKRQPVVKDLRAAIKKAKGETK